MAVQAGLMLGALGMFSPVWADTPPVLPTGGISSTAIITSSGSAMTVDGQSAHNVIAWDTFSIGRDNSVTFTGKNAYLNYVTGSSLSEIYGSILGDKADVYLFNPNGIIFGETANINVGSLYASTKKLKEEDLLAFEQGGTMPLKGAIGGNVVNNMTTALDNMTITLEGDTVSFSNTKLNEAGTELSAPGTATYAVKANALNIGYETENNQASELPLANISYNGAVNYCKLVNDAWLEGNGLTSDGKYMLKEDISKPIKVIENYNILLDGAGHSARLDGNPLFNDFNGTDNLALSQASLLNLTLTGTVTGNGNVGALAPELNGGTISGVINKADVTGAGGNIGGLAGKATDTNIKRSGNEGEIRNTGNSANLGGLVGSMSYGESESVYNKGIIQGGASDTAGGIFGWADSGSISRSYNESKVVGYEAGGIIGKVEGSSSSYCLTNVFNKGEVSGTTAGLLVGASCGAGVNIKDSYAITEHNSLDLVGSVSGYATFQRAYWITSESSVYIRTDYINYYDNAGNLQSEEVPSGEGVKMSDAAKSVFTDGNGWDNSGDLPLLKTFMTPLHIADKTVTYDGKQHDLYYTQEGSASSHLKNNGEKSGKDAGEYRAELVSADQLGYYFVPSSQLRTASRTVGTEKKTASTPSLIINPKAIESATYSVADKTYNGDINADVTVTTLGSDVVEGDTVSLNNVSAAFEDKNAGQGKAVTVTGELTGASAKNYTFISPTNLTGNILPKAIASATYSVDNKIYDGKPDAGVTVALGTDVLNKDDVALDFKANFANKNVGDNKAVTLEGKLTGDDAGNYTLTLPTNLTGSISPKAINSVQYTVEEKTYDGKPDASVTAVLGNDVVEKDDVSLSLKAAFADKTAGTDKTVNVEGALTGDDAGNYTIIIPATLIGDIAKKDITTAEYNVADKPYNGDTAASVTANLGDDVIKGDKVSLTMSSATFADKTAGENKAVTVVGTLTGDDAGNYTITIPATLTGNIAKKDITTAEYNVANKTYDGSSNADVTVTALGNDVLEGDKVSLTISSATFADKTAGENKAVTVEGILTGDDAGNYTITIPATLTGNIAKKTISTAKYNIADKTYDGNTAAKLTATMGGDVVEGDEVTLDSYTATFDDANIGSNRTVTLTGYTLGGKDGQNYVLEVPKEIGTAAIVLPGAEDTGAQVAVVVPNVVVIPDVVANPTNTVPKLLTFEIKNTEEPVTVDRVFPAINGPGKIKITIYVWGEISESEAGPAVKQVENTIEDAAHQETPGIENVQTEGALSGTGTQGTMDFSSNPVQSPSTSIDNSENSDKGAGNSSEDEENISNDTDKG